MSTPNDITISSWAELCERVYDNAWQPAIGRYRSNYAFRGVPDKDQRLLTGFTRNCGDNPQLEYHMLRNFRKYARIEGADAQPQSDWLWLTLAEHHGLPTRLLDWTYSPFVAMHFATVNTNLTDRDGAIWFVDFARVNRMLPPPLVNALNDAGANAFTIGMLERAVPRLSDFDRLDPGRLVLFFEPPSIDARIVNQFAFFSVMSSAVAPLDEWLLAHPDVWQRLIIPRELKWEIRDKLDQANITERMLFPGLDGLASWLSRHYRPRQP
jgi:hypothetical protein